MSGGLLIVGAGGHARVVADAAYCSGAWDKVVMIDDRYPALTSSGGVPVIDSLKAMDSLKAEWPHALIAVGRNELRLSLQDQLEDMGYQLATVIHPSAQVAGDVVIGDGSVLLANSVVNTGARLGRAVILNTAATIDHDCLLGDGVHLSPGVHLAGNVAIGDRTWLGIGSSVVNDCTIGPDVVVGAGGVVIADLPNGVTALGVPAKAVSE